MSASVSRAARRGPFLTSIALSLALLSLLAPSAWAASRNASVIVIDAGHGGFDRGGIPGQRVAEKSMTLDVAQRLARKLRAAGYRVVMTRDSDVFIPLGERVRIANRYRDAIFVSVHFNSATRANANGIETYYYSTQSAALAANIHRQVVAATTSENRGIRRRGYFVLRRATVPAVLVECGFLTNTTEARLVLQSSYRDRLAEQIAAGIVGRAVSHTRPVVAGLVHVAPPIRQPFNDFVRAEAERQPTHRTSRSSKKSKKSSSSSKKKSSSSSKKKSSSSSKKKSTTKKKSSTSETKKKKKADPDE